MKLRQISIVIGLLQVGGFLLWNRSAMAAGMNRIHYSGQSRTVCGNRDLKEGQRAVSEHLKVTWRHGLGLPEIAQEGGDKEYIARVTSELAKGVTGKPILILFDTPLGEKTRDASGQWATEKDLSGNDEDENCEQLRGALLAPNHLRKYFRTAIAAPFFHCLSVNVSEIDLEQDAVFGRVNAPIVVLANEDRKVLRVLKGEAMCGQEDVYRAMRYVLGKTGNKCVHSAVLRLETMLRELTRAESEIAGCTRRLGGTIPVHQKKGLERLRGRAESRKSTLLANEYKILKKCGLPPSDLPAKPSLARR